jgi:Pyruvate/2-oxoacid:ferredoxin oxidoreductase delta subunit
VTSSFIARIAFDSCTGCGNCARDCPIEAIAMAPEKNPDPKSKRKALPVVDSSICLGCGVCTLRCKPGSLRLRKREQRVLHPETNFERILLASLERGTLQNQLFDNPQSLSHAFLRGFIGGFLRLPPVKKALMSDLLRSSFLTFLKKAAALNGQGAFTEI